MATAVTRQVNGHAVSADGAGHRVRVTISLSAQATVNTNTEVSTGPMTFFSDDAGVWSHSLYANSVLKD